MVTSHVDWVEPSIFSYVIREKECIVWLAQWLGLVGHTLNAAEKKIIERLTNAYEGGGAAPPAPPSSYTYGPIDSV